MTASARCFSISRTAGTLGAIALLCCVNWMEGIEIHAFFRLSSFLLVVGIPFFLLLSGYGTSFLAFVPDACKTFFTLSDTPNPKFAEIARSGSQYAIAAGVIGTVFGLIAMLSNLADAGSMGPAIAAAFLAMLYGVILSECVFGASWIAPIVGQRRKLLAAARGCFGRFAPYSSCSAQF